MKKCLRDLRRLEPAADLLKAGEREREPLEREKDTTKETLDEGSRKRRRCQCCSKLLLWLGHSGNGGRAEVCNAAVDEVMQRLAYRGCQCKLSCLVASGSGRLLRPRLLHFNRRLSSATGNCVSAPAAQAIVMQDHHLPQLLSVAPMYA